MRMLLNKKADQKISDNKKITPLELTKRENNIEIQEETNKGRKHEIKEVINKKQKK